MNHYLIHSRTAAHCAVWLTRQANLYDALQKYIENEITDLRRGNDFISSDGYGNEILYHHPLECIEHEMKVITSGRDYEGWGIKLLSPEQKEAAYAEVLVSENPYDLDEYIALCLPEIQKHYPDTKLRAFYWETASGPLLSFYRRQKPSRKRPVEIVARYKIFATDPLTFREWQGSYDDLLVEIESALESLFDFHS